MAHGPIFAMPHRDVRREGARRPGAVGGSVRLMPANPGRNRSAEKQKKKRAAAQQARKAKTVAAKAREAKLAGEEPEAPEGAAPHPFATTEVDYDAIDAANDEIRGLVKKKKLDEAEKKARELAAKHTGFSDGLQRLAEIHEARGDKAKALAALREALERPNEGDEEAHEEIERAIARLGG